MGLRYERVRFQAMGSPCFLHMYARSREEARAIADAAVGEVRRLEAKYTRFRDDSLTAEINRLAGDASGLSVDAETAKLLDYANACYVQSEGRFDITSGVLRRVWDFKSGRLPERAALEAALELVGWSRVSWDGVRIALPRVGMQIDFGGYVKEYAVDRVAELCRDRGMQHGLVDLGGDLGVVGAHPNGAPWLVGIRDPARAGAALARVPLAAGAIATSGDYERGMVVDGKRYSHVLDPRTGWPVEGLRSVSVLAPHCLVAGSASTFAMLFGPSEGADFLEGLGLPHLRIDAAGELRGSLARFAASANGASVHPALSAPAVLPSLLDRAGAPSGL